MRLTIGDPVPHPDVQVLYALDRESENEEGVPVESWDRQTSGYWRGEIGGEVRNLSFRELLELLGEVWTSEHEAVTVATNMHLAETCGQHLFTSDQLAEHDARVRASAEAAVRESLAGITRGVPQIATRVEHLMSAYGVDPSDAHQVSALFDRLDRGATPTAIVKFDQDISPELAGHVQDALANRPSGHQVTDGFRDLVQDVAVTWDRTRDEFPVSALGSALDRLAGAVRAVWGA